VKLPKLLLSAITALSFQAIAQENLKATQEKAAAGDPAAQASLGWRYHLGQGVPKDDNRALELLRASVAAGNASGMTNLADFYYRGDLVPRDLSRAADLNEQAATTKCGKPDEQSCKAVLRGKVNLGLMLVVGDGRPKDERRAVELFKAALSAGYAEADAKAALAGMALNGEGMRPDSQLSIRLFKELAAAGDLEAMRNLGTIYRRGLAGVPVNIDEAKRWYTQAAPKDPASRTALAELLAPQQDPLAAGAQAQRQLLQQQRDEKAFADAIQDTKRRLDQRAFEHTKRLYYAAKAAGIRMTSVASALAGVNVGRRTSGVWELKVDQSLDGPYLVTVLDFLDREAMFAVEGKGTYSVRGYLRDPQFDKSGTFAADCRYQVYVGQRSKFYPCAAYLNGELDGQVERDLKEMLAADIKG
jgi:TPR repeat protein